MIPKHLKTLMEQKGMTIRDLAEKTKKSHPQYSRILTGKVEPTDDTLMEILMIGFDFPYSEAKNLIAKWRAEEALSKADDPQKVKQWIMGDNNTIMGDNHGKITIKR